MQSPSLPSTYAPLASDMLEPIGIVAREVQVHSPLSMQQSRTPRSELMWQQTQEQAEVALRKQRLELAARLRDDSQKRKPQTSTPNVATPKSRNLSPGLQYTRHLAPVRDPRKISPQRSLLQRDTTSSNIAPKQLAPVQSRHAERSMVRQLSPLGHIVHMEEDNSNVGAGNIPPKQKQQLLQLNIKVYLLYVIIVYLTCVSAPTCNHLCTSC